MNKIIYKKKIKKSINLRKLHLLQASLIFFFMASFLYHFPKKTWVQLSHFFYNTAENSSSEPEIIYKGSAQMMPEGHIEWGDVRLSFYPFYTSTHQPLQIITSHEFQTAIKKDFTIYYKGEKLDISRLSMAIWQKEKGAQFCEVDFSVMPDNCYEKLLENSGKDATFYLFFTTNIGRIFYTAFGISDVLPVFKTQNEAIESFIKKHFKDISNKPIGYLLPEPPVFRNNLFRLQWGETIEYLNSHSHSRANKISKKELDKLLNEKPLLHFKNRLIPFEGRVHIWNNNTNYNTCYFQSPEQETNFVQTTDCYKNLLQNAHSGDYITFNYTIDFKVLDSLDYFIYKYGKYPYLYLRSEKMTLHQRFLIDENKNLEEEGSIQLTTSLFNFQMLNLPGKSMIKMDTTSKLTQSFYQLYKNNKGANIIHIPNYKTIKRIIDQHDEIVDTDSIRQSVDIRQKEYALHTFPEFYDFDIFAPRLIWRGLYASLEKEIYDLDDFKFSKTTDLAFYLKNEAVQLRQFELLIVPQKGDIIRYHTNSMNELPIKKAIRELMPGTSIYFKNMLIERKNGELQFFPISLAFHFE